jgi:dihydrofolate reductase
VTLHVVTSLDGFRLSIAPILLGDGLRLFGDSGPEERWRLKDVVAYQNGFVELVYASTSRPAAGRSAGARPAGG